MNILDAEDMIKGLPDQTLMQQAQMPTGELPQFLVISEIQRRSDMRKRHEAQMQEQSQGTVKDQIMREGIAAMMPQQPMGMPPQMMPQGMPPQGMPPQGMPTGMPPMGMAAGGIVRMQEGGVARIQKLMDMLAAGGLSAADLIAQGYTGAEIDAAQNQLRGRMSMPVEGMGGVQTVVPIAGPERAGRMGYGDQYDPPLVRGITDVVSDKASEVADAVGRGIESFRLEAQKQMPNYGLVGRNDLSLPSLPTFERRSQAEMAEMFSPEEVVERLANRPSLADDIGSYFSSRQDESSKPGVESVEPVDQALAVVQEAQTDRSDPRYRPDFSIIEDDFADFATGDKSVQGASPVQTQAKPKGEPEFDISDILEESRSMTKANMLMQLGAGIAEGDLSGGLSRAGAAGMKGAQEQRALDIRKRLAEYQAGREDLAREEKASQFERTFGLSERELAGKMEISKDVTAREGLRGLLALYETAYGEEKEQLKARIMPLINRLLGEEQPEDFGGMQTGQQDYSGFSIRR